MKKIYQVNTTYGTLKKHFFSRSKAAKYYKELKRDFPSQINCFSASERDIQYLTIEDR